MLALAISGNYDVEGTLPGGPATFSGRFLLIQVGRTIWGRGHLLENGLSLTDFDPLTRPFQGSYLDLQAIIPSIIDMREIVLEGKCWLRRSLAEDFSTELVVRGVIHTIEETVILSIQGAGLSGELRLFNWFFIEDLVRNEIWSDFLAFQMRESKPWCSLISHQQLKTSLARLLSRSPIDRNVFIMMRFQKSSQHDTIRKTISLVLAESGLVAQFADSLTVADELWDNVCSYMLASRFGIAIFEEIEERSFNPNVALEVGFMQALQRRVLVLKDRRIPRLPTDLCGRVYREFDSYDLEATLAREVYAWIEELRALGELPNQYHQYVLADRGRDFLAGEEGLVK